MSDKEIFILLESDYDVIEVKGCWSTLEKCLKYIEEHYACNPVLDETFKNIDSIYIKDKNGRRIYANLLIEKRLLDENII